MRRTFNFGTESDHWLTWQPRIRDYQMRKKYLKGSLLAWKTTGTLHSPPSLSLHSSLVSNQSFYATPSSLCVPFYFYNLFYLSPLSFHIVSFSPIVFIGSRICAELATQLLELITRFSKQTVDIFINRGTCPRALQDLLWGSEISLRTAEECFSSNCSCGMKTK